MSGDVEGQQVIPSQNGQTLQKIWRLIKDHIAERSNKRKIGKQPTKLGKMKTINA